MPQPSLDQLLNGVALFDGLTSAQLTQVGQITCHKTVPAGTQIVTGDCPCEALYIILRGTVKVYVENSDGTPVTIGIWGAGEILNDTSAIDGLPQLASAITLEVTSLLWIHSGTFREYIETMPALSRNLTRILARRLRHATAHIQSLAGYDVEARVARQLLSFAHQYNDADHVGSVIPLRLTQSDFASLIGASRVRLNQVLGTYQRHHYISIADNHYITIHDPGALARRCE